MQNTPSIRESDGTNPVSRTALSSSFSVTAAPKHRESSPEMSRQVLLNESIAGSAKYSILDAKSYNKGRLAMLAGWGRNVSSEGRLSG